MLWTCHLALAYGRRVYSATAKTAGSAISRNTGAARRCNAPLCRRKMLNAGIRNTKRRSPLESLGVSNQLQRADRLSGWSSPTDHRSFASIELQVVLARTPHSPIRFTHLMRSTRYCHDGLSTKR
ncbi:hypothetical protein DOTSEDRAFT_68385 [Dothistroma septosporum NZE10]|uniref:Uncharacterized protein n=1 Tax=Dothistroma septosporum (strain NZE10 / CBS 128990) TaxID=675120 RepID=N1Q2Y4_DOTSN|nr:hypothetical protein DOTSEDRAFT_68385 [Dothistroma septosporum NZE10]